MAGAKNARKAVPFARHRDRVTHSVGDERGTNDLLVAGRNPWGRHKEVPRRIQFNRWSGSLTRAGNRRLWAAVVGTRWEGLIE